jgi:signal transduction histidine kinase
MSASHSTNSSSPSLSLLTALLDNSPNGVIAYEGVRNAAGAIIDYRTIYFNPQVLAITGHSAEQMTTQSLFERAPYMREHADDLRRVVDEQIPYEVDELMPTKNRWFVFENRPLPNGFFTTFRDIDDTKRSQQELVRQQQLLQQQNDLVEGVLSASGNGVIVYKAVCDDANNLLDFRVVLANDASLRFSGTPRHEVINGLLTDIYPDTKRLGMWHQYEAVYKTGQTFQGRHYYPGIARWFDITITKLNDGLVATFNDISQLYSATQQLEEQARLFDGVLMNMTNGLTVLEAMRDEAGQIVDVRYVRASQSVLSDTGLTASQIIGQPILTLFPGVKQTAYWTAYLNAFETGEPQHFDVHYTYDGLDNYTDNWVTRLDENRIISIYSLVNEQKQAEARVKQQANLLQTVLDSSQIPIALFKAIRDSAGQIIDFQYLLQNDTNARLVGLSSADDTSKTMLEVLPNLKTAGIFDQYVAVVETGQSQRIEQQFSDGVVDGWFAMSVVKQEDGIVVAVNDQTLLHQTLQRTEQLVSDLKHSNRNLEQFAYIASHDMQEPLRKIQSFGSLLLEHYSEALPEEGQTMLRRMQSAAGRMSQLIRDLLAYSHLSIEHAPAVAVSLQRILLEIQSDLELAIQEKHARILVSDGSGSGLPVLTGNPTQLRQLFQNLLSNALKFARPNTVPKVSIRAYPILPDAVPDTVPNRLKRSWVAIDVTDNGIGFDEKYGEQIFQLFERLHGRNEYSGTGIGLAVCRKVAENHGGTITVRSQPGQGTTFTVYLPK